MKKTLVNLSVYLRDTNKRKRYQILVSSENVNPDYLCSWTWEKGEDLINYETVSVRTFNINRLLKRSVGNNAN